MAGDGPGRHEVEPGSTRELADLSAGDVLAFVEDRHAARLAAERDVLRAAYQWAVLHHPGPAARERARPAGADGTPLITEHAAAVFGARIQTSPYGARRLIADAVDIALRLPRLHAGITAGTVRVAHARHVAQMTRELPAAEAAWVDGEVAESADGRLAWARFEALVEGKVAAAAPELARAKEEHAARERSARMSRVNRYGTATFTVRADAATILGLDAAVTAVAQRLESRLPDATAHDRRVAAVALLANPEAHPDPSVGPVRPKVKIYLHLHPGSPAARMECHGPVTTDWVRHLLSGHLGPLAQAPTVRVTPVVDLNNQAPVDAYEIPAALREAVHLIHPADVFPFAANLSRQVDLDHAHAYRDGGLTAVGNLGPLTRAHHRIKTHHVENGSRWQVRHPFPGIVVWRDPYGAHYLVDQTGTRRVTGIPDDSSPTPAEIHFAETMVNYLAA